MVPRRPLSSLASLDPEPAEFGVRPLPMDVLRWLHLVGDDECVLRLVSKPDGEEAPPVSGRMATISGERRWRPTARSSLQRIQGLECNFHVFRVFSANGMVVQLSSVSYHSVPVWVLVFVPYV